MRTALRYAYYFSGSEALPILAIENIDSIRVPEGTAFENINFSDYARTNVITILDDGTFSTATIEWAAGSYDGDTPDTYTLNGTLTGAVGSNNTNNIVPQISVQVIAIPAGYQTVLDSVTADKRPTPINQGDQIRLYNTYAASIATMDAFWNTLTDGHREFALKNWKNPGTNDLVEHGSLIFTPRKGFTGDGATGYLSTGITLSTATNYTQNSGGFGGYVYSPPTTGIMAGAVATGARLTLQPRGILRDCVYEVNGNTNPSQADSYCAGWYHIYRTVSGSINYTKNAVTLASAVVDVSVARPAAELYLLARNNAGTADIFSDGTLSCFWVGAPFNGAVATLADGWQTYLRSARVKNTYGANDPIGELVDDDFARASLGNSYQTTGGTWSCDGSKLVASGGASDMIKRLLYRYGHSSERCVIEATVQCASAPGVATTGIGIGFSDHVGLNGQRSVVGQLNFANAGDGGKVIIKRWDGTTETESAISDDGFTVAQNDTFNLRLEKSITAGLVKYDLSATRVSDSVVKSCSHSALLGDSTSDFAMWTFGGTTNITNFKVTISDEKNHKLAIVGDSLSHGYAADSLDDRYASNIVESFQVSAGSGDTIADVIGTTTAIFGKLKNVLDLHAKYYALMIGGNDEAGGIADATWQAHLKLLVNTIKNEGHKVILMNPFPRDDGNMSVFGTHYASAYANDIIITETFDDMKDGANTTLNPLYDFGDGVHMNTAGHVAAAAVVVANLPTLF